MSNFLSKEKDKLEDMIHQKKEEKQEKKQEKEEKQEKKQEKEDSTVKFYKNESTGAIISRQEYMDMKYGQELALNNIMQPNLYGINNAAPLMEEEIVQSNDIYVPYIPEDEKNK